MKKPSLAYNLLLVFASFLALSFVVFLGLVWATGKTFSPSTALVMLTHFWAATVLISNVIPLIRVHLATRQGERSIEEIDMRLSLQIIFASATTLLWLVDILIGCFADVRAIDTSSKLFEFEAVAIMRLQVPTWYALARRARQRGSIAAAGWRRSTQ